MKKLFKPNCLLLYLLTIIVFFFIGAFYVGITGAVKDQGLAGGAIVFWYAINFSFFALIVSFFIVYRSSPAQVVRMNKFMAIGLLIVLSVFIYLFLQRKKASAVSPFEMPVTIVKYPDESGNNEMGMGFFSPDFTKNSTLYFYSNPNYYKGLLEHPPIDSINFFRNEKGNFDISYAPPWLQPEHLKLDYEIMYFKIRSLTRDFVEVIVNTTNQKTIFVNRYAGDISLWPDFLLGVHSVEFISPTDHPVKIKPLSHASEVTVKYEFMHPIMIREEWMQVELMDNGFKVVGEGWILWKRDEKLLINYSLLS